MDELSRYAAPIDLDNENDSHVLMIRLVGGGKRVLDVGCWTGDLGAYFARYNPTVVGVEVDPNAAEQAAKVLDDVVVADVEKLDFLDTFGADAFDVIVFGDVLEHLVEPGEVLRRCLRVLSPTGFVVASIPNVAHGSVRLSLLQGEFKYGEVGLLDRTHLRFFTRASIHELFENAGLAIVESLETTIDPMLAPETNIDASKVDADVLNELRSSRDALVYQFVVKAVRDDARASIAKLLRREEASERRVEPVSGGVVRLIAVGGADTPQSDHDLAAAVLERELRARGVESVVRAIGESWPVLPGAVADGVVWLGPAPLPGPLRFEPAAVSDDLPPVSSAASLAALSRGLLGPGEMEDAQALLQAVGAIPAEPYFAVAADGESLAEIVDLLMATRREVPVLVIASLDDDTDKVSPLIEARSPGAVIQRGSFASPHDRVAAIAGATLGLISTSVVDCAIAAAYERPFAWLDGTPQGARHGVALLDASMSPGDRQRDWHQIRQDAESQLDRLAASVAGLAASAPDPLLDAHRQLQRRVVSERQEVARRLGDLEAAVASAQSAVMRAERLDAEIARLDRLLAIEHAAIAQLQGHAIPAAVPARRRLSRRIAGKALRTLRLR